MEILQRAKGNAGEIVAWNESESNVREEVFKRASRAGYMTRNGECANRTKIQNRGYGDKPLNVWPRDEQGNLIGD